jgi:selenocysteine lyase/cysteine desulfurase
MDLHDLVARLRREGVYIALRKGRLRISPHYYNTSAEVGEFLSALGGLMRPAAARRAVRARS